MLRWQAADFGREVVFNRQWHRMIGSTARRIRIELRYIYLNYSVATRLRTNSIAVENA